MVDLARFLFRFVLPPRTSSVEDVKQAGLIIDGHLLAVRVLNGRIVLIDEVVLDELDGKSALADTTTAYKDTNIGRLV